MSPSAVQHPQALGTRRARAAGRLVAPAPCLQALSFHREGDVFFPLSFVCLIGFFLDDAGSIFSLKRGKKKKPFPWKKGCQPSLERFVIQMRPQSELPLGLCGREALVAQERLKELRD